MIPLQRFLVTVGGLALLTLVGAVGFRAIEGFVWIDAFYMSVITLSTVGFGEVRPLSPSGRLFTSGLIIVGVGSTLYLLTTLAELVIAGTLRDLVQRRSMQRSIDEASGHIIICGFGRFGRVVAEELDPAHQPIVIVESDPGKEAELVRLGYRYMIGSALEDSVLEAAGIERADDLIACAPSDADNLFITLAAREQNPRVRVHARAESEGSIRRLRTAGAHQVISSYQIGAQRIAASILRPAVVDFLEIARPSRGGEVDLEEVRIGARSPLIDRTVQEIEESTLRIVALKRGSERIELVPAASMAVKGGDHLVVIGERVKLSQLAQKASGAG